MPLVSVVIPNWNGARLLPTCLDATLAQMPGDLEVIVADDGSTDESVEIVAERFPGVQLVRLPTNRGFTIAANAGIEASGGEFVALLNNDAEMEPRCLEELVRAIRGDSRLGMCAPKMVYYDEPKTINSAGHACNPDGVVVDIGRGQPDGPWFDQPREVLGACAGAALYRREMLEEIGLFDESLVMSFEDADLNWRAQWAGWRCRYVPTAVVKHREGSSRGIASRRSVLLGLRNTIILWVKDWPAASLLWHLQGIWRGLRRAMASLMFRGYGGVLPAVLLGVVCQMPTMLSRRRRIRRRRAVAAARFEQLVSSSPRETSLTPFDSGVRLGMVRLTQQACAGALSLLILLLVLGAATLVDLTERRADGRRRPPPAKR